MMEKGMKRFAGKVVLVTGGAGGIGRAICLRFAEEGADIVTCDLKEEHLKETVKMVTALGRKALGLTCVIGSEEDMKLLVDNALQAFGKIDILVNNAGVGDTNVSFEDLDAALWDRIYNTNVKGPFFLIQRVAKQMIEKGIKGRIISIASTEGKTNRAGSIAYSSSKHALIGLTQGLAIQLAPYWITVNAVCPGLIDTPIYHKTDEQMGMEHGSMIKMIVDMSIESRMLKLARIGMPEDIAGAVVFLASDDASYMTGQAVNVCGGIEFH
jgi:NAD(P)-dependent dehydrogenase (short-subunit alcohol dehydrogenase family)